MEQNYRLTIAYDGSRFFGWERQPDKDTIQGKLEAVLGALQGHPVNVIGAGRTDAGVHARAMTASVVLDVTETPDAIRDYLNRYLPDAIAVREVKEAAPRFHARYNALGKTYRYTCHTGPVKPVFDRKYVTLLDYDPDVEKMRQAAAYLLGENDFASFCGNPRMKKSTVRLVDHIAIERRKDGWYSPSMAPAFCRTWSASWWARCWRWAAATGRRSRCVTSWPPGTASRRAPPRRRRACA